MSTLAITSNRSIGFGRITLPAGLLGAFMCLAGGTMALAPALDPDLGWHLQTGYGILQTHTIPTADPYSFTMRRAPWVEHEWLWQTAMAFVHSLTGELGLIVFNALLVSGALGLIYAGLRVRQVSPMFATLGVAVSVTLLIAPTGVRPAMVILPMSALYVLLFELYKQRCDWRWLAALVPCQVVWANSHGSYLIGPLLCAIYGAAALWETHRLRAVRAWAAVFAGLMCASLINPLGPGLLRFALLASRLPFNREYTAEWQAPDFSKLPFVPLLVCIAVSVLLATVCRSWPNSKPQILLLTAGTAAALWSNQFTGLYAIVAAPLVGELAFQLAGRPHRGSISAVSLLMLVFASVLIFVAGPARRLAPDAYQLAVADKFPVKAVDYIQSHDLSGPMWNEFDWGGYLIGALPQLPVFVDGRTEMYGEAFMDKYTQVELARVPPQGTLDRNGIQLVLIFSHSPVATELRQDLGWNEAYKDSLASVFVRT